MTTNNKPMRRSFEEIAKQFSFKRIKEYWEALKDEGYTQLSMGTVFLDLNWGGPVSCVSGFDGDRYVQAKIYWPYAANERGHY
jgi:hypothetical protein